ncbi:MAG: hypothetical protein R2715_21175 [Ilumatobacteraceae bacterium]
MVRRTDPDRRRISAPPRLHELDGVLAGRVLAIVTDRRIVFFHRRPWRATPGRFLTDIRFSELGNVELVRRREARPHPPNS